VTGGQEPATREWAPAGRSASDPGMGSGGQERSDPGIDSGGLERSDPGIDSGGLERSDPGIDSGGLAVSAGQYTRTRIGPAGPAISWFSNPQFGVDRSTRQFAEPASGLSIPPSADNWNGTASSTFCRMASPAVCRPSWHAPTVRTGTDRVVGSGVAAAVGYGIFLGVPPHCGCPPIPN